MFLKLVLKLKEQKIKIYIYKGEYRIIFLLRKLQTYGKTGIFKKRASNSDQEALGFLLASLGQPAWQLNLITWDTVLFV